MGLTESSFEYKDYFPDQNDQKLRIEETNESLCNSKTITGDENKIAITGRSKDNYSLQLFPDIKQVISFLKDKDYLDLACGINHLSKESLLNSLSKDKLRHGLDIHDLNTDEKHIKYIQGSVYNMKTLPKYDVITCNNFLYFWELNPKELLKAFLELNQHLKKNGEIRIFPIYYSDYSLSYIPLHKFLNEQFWISCIQPDYSDESPLLYKDGSLIKAPKNDGLYEKKENKELISHTLILKNK